MYSISIQTDREFQRAYQLTPLLWYKKRRLIVIEFFFNDVYS